MHPPLAMECIGQHCHNRRITASLKAMRIALLQSKVVAGDIAGNVVRILEGASKALDMGADLVVTSELATVGYPSRDLLSRDDVIDRNLVALDELQRKLPIPAIVGFVDRKQSEEQRSVYNAAAFLANNTIQHVYHKRLLPTYDVFDEWRYFDVGRTESLIDFGGIRIGLSICEDAWNISTQNNTSRYRDFPIRESVQAGADLLINLSASPFRMGKRALRKEIFGAQARLNKRTLLVANLVGAHDDLIFDGGSMFFSPDGTCIAQANEFGEDILLCDVSDPARPQLPNASTTARSNTGKSENEAILDALILGVQDYATTCGFKSAILGLSGGIDSALTAAIAAEALGPGQVHAIAMPSQYSSDHSIHDAQNLAKQLGLAFQLIPIQQSVETLEASLQNAFAGKQEDVTEENIQARMRALILMALSNKHGHLLLATGNKSEMAVGYTTLYGDMCGGLAVLADVFKTRVYQLAELFNQRKGFDAIPQSTMTKAPSAELRPNQTDQDSLPEYEVLDEILRLHIEESLKHEDITKKGFSRELVDQSLRMLARTEYKRFQSAPILRVSKKAFGPGRRMPIAARPLVIP